MARPRTVQKRQAPAVTLSPETKRGIWAIVVLVIAAVMLLGLFNLAGPVGRFIDYGLQWVAGWGHWIAPMLLGYLGIALLLFQPNRRTTTGGVIITVLSWLAFLQLVSPGLSSPEVIIVGHGGGYLGLAIALPLNRLLGWWAALIVTVGLIVVGLLMAFNTTLQQLLAPATAIGSWRWRRHNNQTETEPVQPELPVTVNVTAVTEAEANEDNIIAPQPKLIKPRVKIDLPLDLLTSSSEQPTSGDIKANQEKIKATLKTFGIEVEMDEVNVGPTVTQFTLKPADGIKLSQIVALQNDLALALAAHPLRMEAPIPGKSLVGIEVPNQSVAVVKLRDILESPQFKARRTSLTVALGKDVAGQSAAANLGVMPHCLIAGATGSGKSVCLNSFIVSLLYQNSPESLRFILVDPKRVELTIYNDIPHLLTPVIHEVDQTVNALRWAVGQMDYRYKLLAGARVRSLVDYNQKVLVGKLPYIVIIIDELADLMAVAARDVEAAIIRLAQMARAVGIHLILATQRPSVNVITGLIKANITTRLAFAVASQTDSRTILDSAGAEKLLGRGDMLYISADSSKPKRLQGCLVTDDEIEQVCRYLKDRAEPEYDEGIIERQKTSSGSGVYGVGSDDDPLLGEAEAVVTQADKASASLLQRRLRVGYARAARLLDLLEERGVIGPGDGAKPRDVLTRRSTSDSSLTTGVEWSATDELDDETSPTPEP